MSQNVVAYFRTSSMKNVGTDKDSLSRQKSSVKRYCDSTGSSIKGEFYDKGVTGTLDILNRPQFVEMISFCDKHDIKTIVFENSTRLSRDLICQETGFQYLSDLGFTLISAESPESFVDDSPTATLIRQVLGCISQFDKSQIVQKLQSGRMKKSMINREKGIISRSGKGKVGGKKRISEENPEITDLVRKLRKRTDSKGKPMSFRKIERVLKEEHDHSISHVSVKRILEDVEIFKREERNRKRRK